MVCPHDLVPAPDQAVSQDPMRPDVWRVNLTRNCPKVNSHMPVASVGGQSNNDGQGVLTRHAAENYCCKYAAKQSKPQGARSSLHDVIDGMDSKDTAARDKFGEGFEESKLGRVMHKVFMAEIGEEHSAAELAHIAAKCPTYLCSRNQKIV